MEAKSLSVCQGHPTSDDQSPPSTLLFMAAPRLRKRGAPSLLAAPSLNQTRPLGKGCFSPKIITKRCNPEGWRSILGQGGVRWLGLPHPLPPQGWVGTSPSKYPRVFSCIFCFSVLFKRSPARSRNVYYFIFFVVFINY